MIRRGGMGWLGVGRLRGCLDDVKIEREVLWLRLRPGRVGRRRGVEMERISQVNMREVLTPELHQNPAMNTIAYRIQRRLDSFGCYSKEAKVYNERTRGLSESLCLMADIVPILSL